MSRGQWSILLSLLGAFILVVAACAPAVTPTPTATPTPPPVVATPTPGVATPTPAPGVATPTPTAATPTPEVGVAGMPVGYGYSEFGEWGMPLNMPPPQYGGVFRMAHTSPSSHFDSHRIYSHVTLHISGPVFDSLLHFSPYLDAAIIPTTFELRHIASNLAERWEISPDGLTVTFYLKRGVKWHDGAPFTAKDVVYSFNKLLDRKTSVHTAELTMLARVERIDDYTVKAYLKYPAWQNFLLIIAEAKKQMQAEHLKDVSYRTTGFLVGTNAWKLKSYTPGIESVLERNPDYHFKGRPYFDNVKYSYLADATTVYSTLAAGQIDYNELLSREADYELLRKLAPELIIKLQDKIWAGSAVFFGLVREGPLQDPRVRKALVMVQDGEELCQVQYGALLQKIPKMCYSKSGYFISAPLGRGLPWSEYEKVWWRNRPMAERSAEGKRLLAEAGYPRGLTLEWMATAALSGSNLVVLDNWKKWLGVETKIRMVPAALNTELLTAADFEIGTQGLAAWSGTMEEIVSCCVVAGGNANHGRYTHPKVEELWYKMQREPEWDKRVDLLHQIERFIIDDVPYLNTYHWSRMHVYWPYVKPQIFMPPAYHTGYNTIYNVIWFDRNDPTWAKRGK